MSSTLKGGVTWVLTGLRSSERCCVFQEGLAQMMQFEVVHRSFWDPILTTLGVLRI